MPLTKDQKIKALDKAIEIAKEFSRGSLQIAVRPPIILKESYEVITKILEEIESEK